MCAIGRAFDLDDAGIPWSDQRWPLATVCPVVSTALPADGTGVPVWCDWLYVDCDSRTNSVVSFETSRYGGSTGSNFPQTTLPTAFGTLRNLQRLKLNSANLNGTIPTALGSLSQLTLLDLSYNQLTGPIPPLNIPLIPNRSRNQWSSEISQLALQYNYLAGTVPAFVWNLRYFYVGNYRFQSTLQGNCDLQSAARSLRDYLTDQGNCAPPVKMYGFVLGNRFTHKNKSHY